MARPRDLWICDQVETLAVAVAMALVLKFFVIEAYQIPTGSMQPTMLGDAGARIQDRVLADKLCTMLRDPRRYEVMIFRFPWDERRLYVKRIVGLPGETLEIAGGDLWADGRLARKPDNVNDSVLKAIFPVRDGGMDIGRAFSAGAGITVSGGQATFAPDSAGELRLRETVRADYLHGYDPDWGIQIPPSVDGTDTPVSDLELAATVSLGPSARELSITLMSDEGDTIVRITPAAGDGQAQASVSLAPADGGAPRELGRAPAPSGDVRTGGRFRIAARDVDRQFVLFVDGDEWLRLPDDVSGPRTDRPRRALAALALRGGGSVEDLVVRRDIYYQPPRSGQVRWEIPEDSYFAMGDNTQGSYDSRSWSLETFRLPDREITGFWFENRTAPDCNPRPLPDGRISFADIHGNEHVFAESELLEPPRTEPGPFIHRRYLLGKAIAVFWPIISPFRWKLIR
jgi:signal peptidase I